MDPRSPGMQRYFYEYVFHQAIERAKARMAADHQNVAGQRRTAAPTIMVSAARRMRTEVEAKLPEGGFDARPDISQVLGAIEETMAERVAGHEPIFGSQGTADPAYRAMLSSFTNHIGQSGPTGQAGPRLPISPYDPRWSNRSTVQRMGSALTFVLDADVEQMAGGRVDRVARLQSEELRLHTVEDGRAREAGRAVAYDDLTGMSTLMSRMSPDQYADARNWVNQGLMLPGGRIDRTRTMTPGAVERAAAILDELQQQGVPYEVVRDRRPGQLAAQIAGTKIQVRLTDSRESEDYVGRVWDDGVAMYYTTNVSEDRSNKRRAYRPTVTETVNLVRLAQGLPAERSDGQGEVGQRNEHRRGRARVQDSYYVDKGAVHMAVVRDAVVDGRVPFQGAKVFVRRDARERTAAARWFGTPEDGERYLRGAVDSARENIAELLDVDRLVEEHATNAEAAEAGEYFPEFSGDTEVAAVQRAYWDVLRGAQDTLLRPGATPEEYDEATAYLAEVDFGPEQRQVAHDMSAARFAYTGTPEERVRAHAADVPEGMVGTYDPRDVVDDAGDHHLKRFDPVRVAKYMSSDTGTWANTSHLVSALRAAEVDPAELMGEGYGSRAVKDRLVKFDEASARTLEELPEDSMTRRMVELTRDTLERNGTRVVDLRVDDNGIIAWEAEQLKNDGEVLEKGTLRGEIGQVFEPGSRGEVITRFASGEDYMLVPGYEARIAMAEPGSDATVEERTLLRGYEQQMAEAIRYRVSQDVLTVRTRIGEPTSVNGVYRRLYDERLPVDFLERAEERGLGRGWADSVVDTLARRVRYPDAMGDTFYQDWRRSTGQGVSDPANDNRFDALVLSGGRNMAILSEEQKGYFDPDMTNASKMGTTFYLTEGAQVDPETGRITPSADPEDRAPLMKHPETEFMRYNSWDRRQMISSMLLHATGVTAPEKVMMSDVLKGWTADDGRIVSKDYAERNQIMGPDGTMRPLMVGDKDSDLHGNKGVIGLVIDPDMDLAEAREQGIEDAVKMFRDNPGLSVVMSPFSGVSRFNGGTAREMMQDTTDAVMPDGTVVPDAIGTMRLVITNKDVEAGTRHYDDEAIAQGKGRRASAQLAWGLGSVGADAVMAEFYGPNGAGASNLREMLITMGLDMAPDGTLLPEQAASTAAERRLFEQGEVPLSSSGAINRPAVRRQFSELIADRGGDMEIPFPLKFPNENLTPGTGRGTWRLPVLSSHLRSGTELDDGTSTAHDYTNQYLAIHEHACAYRYAAEQLERDDLSPDRRRAMEARMAEAPGGAQAAFERITSSLEQRHFSGKRNIFKEQVMSARLPNSATAVWTADPRLELDQVGMGPELAEGLGVSDGDNVLIWRDPVLRDGGVRYLRVKTDERLTGVAINPVMDKSFDGDFDGDSVGIAVLHSEKAKQQARELLSVEANLLDTGSLDPEGFHQLNMQDSLDTKVSQHFDPDLGQRFEALKIRANESYEDFSVGEIDRRQYLTQNREVLAELNSYYADALGPQAKGVTLRFSSAADHVASMNEACIETGAKGSPAKLAAYARYFGVDEKGTDLERPWSELEPDKARQADEGVQVAVTVKTAVGVAGAYSQRGVKALRNEELKAILELTHPVTESALKAKHNPTEAMDKYTMLMGPARNLWRGRLMQQIPGPDGRTTWAAARDEKGNEVQATPEQWAKQFVEMYESKNGLNVSVNPDYVDRVATALSENGRMIDIEDAEVSAAIAPKGSTMDRLAYGGTFKDVMAAAARGENLYDGSQNGAFAPYVIRSNQQAMTQQADAYERRADDTRGVPAPELETFGPRDVQADERFRARGAGKRSDRAVAVKARRPVPVIEEPEPAMVAGDNDYYSL